MTQDAVAPPHLPASPAANCGSREHRTIPSQFTAHQRSLWETPGGSANRRRWDGRICQNGIDRTYHMGVYKHTIVGCTLTWPIVNSMPPFGNAQRPVANSHSPVVNSKIVFALSTTPFACAQPIDVNANRECQCESTVCAFNIDVCEFAATRWMLNITDCERAITHLKCLRGRLSLLFAALSHTAGSE